VDDGAVRPERQHAERDRFTRGGSENSRVSRRL